MHVLPTGCTTYEWFQIGTVPADIYTPVHSPTEDTNQALGTISQ